MQFEEFEVLKHAIDTYGKQSQLTVAMEEMAELTKELSKNIRGNDNIFAIAEETAEVLIMLEQIQMIFGNRRQVEEFRQQKIRRLANRLEVQP